MFCDSQNPAKWNMLRCCYTIFVIASVVCYVYQGIVLGVELIPYRQSACVYSYSSGDWTWDNKYVWLTKEDCMEDFTHHWYVVYICYAIFAFAVVLIFCPIISAGAEQAKMVKNQAVER